MHLYIYIYIISLPPNIKRGAPQHLLGNCFLLLGNILFLLSDLGNITAARHRQAQREPVKLDLILSDRQAVRPADLGKCEAGFGQPRSQTELQQAVAAEKRPTAGNQGGSP